MTMTTAPAMNNRRAKPQQRGVALFVVIVFVLLSMLLALWASRTAWFNELVVGNDADFERAFAAAEAMMTDAELDIRLGNDSVPGISCGSNVCRRTTDVKIPLKSVAGDVETLLRDDLDSQPGCAHGLCRKHYDTIATWGDPDRLEAMKNVAARYGTYTGAKIGDDDNPINPILQYDETQPAGEAKAWYWIEVMPINTEGSEFEGLIVGNSGQSGTCSRADPPIVYRITALTHGLKPNTSVMLREVFCLESLQD